MKQPGDVFNSDKEKRKFIYEWERITTKLKDATTIEMPKAKRQAYLIAMTHEGQEKIERAVESGNYKLARILIREQISRLSDLRETFPNGGIWK